MNLPEITFDSLPFDLGIAVGIGIATMAILYVLFSKASKVEGKKLSLATVSEKVAAPGLVVLLTVFLIFTFAAGLRHDANNSERLTALQTQATERYGLSLTPVQAEQLLNATPTIVGKNTEEAPIILHGTTQTWNPDSEWLQGVFLYQEGDTYKLAFQGGAANIVELPLSTP